MTEPIEVQDFVRAVGDRFGTLASNPDLYEIADRVCLWYALNLEMDPGAAAALNAFRTDDGLYLEREATHHPWHSTAFAVAALELLDAQIEPAIAFDPYREAAAAVAFLDGLDWETRVYLGSHEGAALLSLAALLPSFADDGWFDEVLGALGRYVDPATGMHGIGKPPVGDLDQIGGSFHYHFVLEHLGRPFPFPEARVDAVLGLQGADGIWHRLNPFWLTLDALYLMARSPVDDARRNQVAAATLDAVRTVEAEFCGIDGTHFDGPLGAHSAVAIMSLLTVAQQVLGPEIVVTDEPLRLVLDRRPFI